MKVKSNIVNVLIDVESGEGSIAFSKAWEMASTLWKMDILADLMTQIESEFQACNQQFRAEMDVLREKAESQRHLELVKAKEE